VKKENQESIRRKKQKQRKKKALENLKKKGQKTGKGRALKPGTKRWIKQKAVKRYQNSPKKYENIEQLTKDLTKEYNKGKDKEKQISTASIRNNIPEPLKDKINKRKKESKYRKSEEKAEALEKMAELMEKEGLTRQEAARRISNKIGEPRYTVLNWTRDPKRYAIKKEHRKPIKRIRKVHQEKSWGRAKKRRETRKEFGKKQEEILTDAFNEMGMERVKKMWDVGECDLVLNKKELEKAINKENLPKEQRKKIEKLIEGSKGDKVWIDSKLSSTTKSAPETAKTVVEKKRKEGEIKEGAKDTIGILHTRGTSDQGKKMLKSRIRNKLGEETELVFIDGFSLIKGLDLPENKKQEYLDRLLKETTLETTEGIDNKETKIELGGKIDTKRNEPIEKEIDKPQITKDQEKKLKKKLKEKREKNE